MIKRPVVMAVAAACLLLSACSSQPSGPTYSYGTPIPAPTGSTPAPITDLTHATAAKGSPSDTTVSFTPKLYANAGNPCAGLTDNVRVGQAPGGCSLTFVSLGLTIVPGSELIGGYRGPLTAKVETGVPAATAKALGTGFAVDNAVRLWSIGSNQTALIPIIDGGSSAPDAVYKEIAAKPIEYAQTPVCVFPTSLRIVTAPSSVQSYMEGLGWAFPSQYAIVATYTQCVGMTIKFRDGSTAEVLGHTQPVSIVTTGKVIDIEPFGPMFVEDGWAPCGVSQLQSVCG